MVPPGHSSGILVIGFSIQRVPGQAGADQRQLARAEQCAALEAQAAALSARMAESHLAVFRAEAKNRRGRPQTPQAHLFAVPGNTKVSALRP